MPSPCTVSGNLRQLSNGVIANGQVIFELSNIGTGNPLIVSGTGIFPALKYIAQSASDGSFTQAIWGNDNISPSNTIYNVTFRDNSGNEVGPIQYSITGATANLNSLAAAGSTTPPILLPGGAVVLSVVAPTVAAGQIGLGSTTATSASTGANGDVPAQVVGYLIINVAGTVMKVPYYNT